MWLISAIGQPWSKHVPTLATLPLQKDDAPEHWTRSPMTTGYLAGTSEERPRPLAARRGFRPSKFICSSLWASSLPALSSTRASYQQGHPRSGQSGACSRNCLEVWDMGEF